MAAGAVALAGCGGGSSQQSTSTKTSAAQKPLAQPQAKVSFIAPKNGGTIPGTVIARVRVTGIKLDPAAVGKPAKRGEGHLHFSMDGGKYDLPKYSGANGRLAVKLGVQGKYSPSVTPTITYKGLPAGNHKLEVYVANNDHTNAGPNAEVQFTTE
ncbi:MAG: hypothetical protein ACJ76S_06915 [Solirubrobacteraceae bacterium]|jgi:hypothetical protein